MAVDRVSGLLLGRRGWIATRRRPEVGGLANGAISAGVWRDRRVLKVGDWRHVTAVAHLQVVSLAIRLARPATPALHVAAVVVASDVEERVVDMLARPVDIVDCRLQRLGGETGASSANRRRALRRVASATLRPDSVSCRASATVSFHWTTETPSASSG